MAESNAGACSAFGDSDRPDGTVGFALVVKFAGVKPASRAMPQAGCEGAP